MLKFFLAICFCALATTATAQNNPFIKLVYPSKTDVVIVGTGKQFVSGATCKTCSLSINGRAIKVYKTGSFAIQLDLNGRDTVLQVIATNEKGTITTKTLKYTVAPKAKPDSIKTLSIADIQILPEGNLYVHPGDRLFFKVKAQSGCKVNTHGNTTLHEMPSTNKAFSFYQGEYVVKDTDSFLVSKLAFTITDKTGKKTNKQASSTISMFSELAPNIAKTKGRLAHLLFGLGDDRLGGAKIGYIDSSVLLNVVGKVGANYKVQLSKYRTAFVPDDVIDFLPKGTFTPQSLTHQWRIYGDSLYDYVTIGLFAKLPYQSMHNVNPSSIVVDIFGATNNTNWITRLENTQEISNVSYEQVEDEVFRVNIDLKHNQHWGHSIYYNGNNLVIKIRRQPKQLKLSALRIAVDAGHGASNSGAEGPSGSSEKAIALQLSLKLQQLLEKQGAKVIMTRTKEMFFDNKERILFYRDSLPDLLVSFHLNSGADPVNAKGTSVFYKYEGFREFGNAIYKKLLELGFKEYGNNSSFNFMLNSPIEYPNALLETAFISNPEDEEKMVDEDFQWQLAQKVLDGIVAFLENVEE